MKISTSLLLFFVLASICLQANAQTPAPSTAATPQEQKVKSADETDVVRVTTNLIQVDAVVTDKQGKIVTNLKPEDFEIFVNGKPQQITNFSFVTIEPQPGEPLATRRNSEKSAQPISTARLRPEQVTRTIALVIDDLSIGCKDMPHVQRSLRKFVDEQMQPGDLVGIVRAGSGVGSLQQFTSNKQQLYAAIERVVYNPASCNCMSTCGGTDRLDLIKEVNIEDPNRDIKGNDDDAVVRHDNLANAALAATKYVIDGMRDLPGRKAVMLFSEGFFMAKRGLPEYNAHVRVTVERLVDSANRAGAVIYTIDARGLVADGLTAADGIDGMANRMKNFLAPREGLIYLAKQAGGFASYDTNDFSSAIREALDDQKSYYLIGYQPDASLFDPTKSRFNQLTVKVKGSGLNVRYRSGFFGIKDEQRKIAENTPQQQILKALASPFAAGDINLRFTPLFTNDATGGSFVRSLVHISTKDLTFTDKPDGMHEAVINIVAYTFDDDSKVADTVGETHTITLSDKLYQRALTSGLVYSLKVPIKTAGAYQLRVAVRDDKSQKIGTASQFINIPDLKKERLTLSGIALNSYDLKEKGNITNAAYNQTSGESSGNNILTQGALRRFRPGHVLQFAYAIYNAQLDKSTNQPQLTTQVKLYRDGKEIFAGKETAYNPKGQPDPKRLLAEGGLQLGGLQEGEYVLQVVVTDALAKGKHRTTTSWTDFELAK